MNFFIRLDESHVESLLLQVSQYLDNFNNIITNHDNQLDYKNLREIEDTLENIKDDMNDKLTEEELEAMKKRFGDE